MFLVNPFANCIKLCTNLPQIICLKRQYQTTNFFNVFKSSYGTIDLLKYRVVTICFQHYLYFATYILSLITHTAFPNRQGVQQILGSRLVSPADEGQEALPDAWLGEDRQFETPADILEEHRPVEALEIDQALGTKNRRWQRLYGLHELFTIQGTLKPQILGPQAHFGIRGMAGSNVVMCGSRRRFFPVYVKTGRILHIKNQSRV